MSELFPQRDVKGTTQLLYGPSRNYSPCVLCLVLGFTAVGLTAFLVVGYRFNIGTGQSNTLAIQKWSNLLHNLHHQQANQYSSTPTDERSLVPGCNSTNCRPPTCHCASTSHPGNFPLREVPMMVMLTFDDHVNSHNYANFEKLFSLGLRNPNGCPSKFTYFVSDRATEYKYISTIYQMGHELGSHSISHRFPLSWWSNASFDDLTREFGGQRSNLVEQAGVPLEDIRGVRVPFLAVNADPLMSMIADSKFEYDSSLVSTHEPSRGEDVLWPFTMDHPPRQHIQNMQIPDNASYPGIWEIPLSPYACDEGLGYFMVDQCSLPNDTVSIHGYLWRHFAYHYKTRTPMGLFMHASWFARNNASLEALAKFLEDLTSQPYVWLVSLSQVLDWMRAPTPMSDMLTFQPWQC